MVKSHGSSLIGMASSPTQRVCVIGAGIAGLVTAKVLREDGFDIVVLEKEATIGGVWAASRTYPGLRTNNPRESYAFSDHPYPATADAFPTAEQVRAYLKSINPLDKAGAYAIQGQGDKIVQTIAGSYTNVVGMPAAETLDMLLAAGVLRSWP